jgi:hypothetical protein
MLDQHLTARRPAVTLRSIVAAWTLALALAAAFVLGEMAFSTGSEAARRENPVLSTTIARSLALKAAPEAEEDHEAHYLYGFD